MEGYTFSYEQLVKIYDECDILGLEFEKDHVKMIKNNTSLNKFDLQYSINGFIEFIKYHNLGNRNLKINLIRMVDYTQEDLDIFLTTLKLMGVNI